MAAIETPALELISPSASISQVGGVTAAPAPVKTVEFLNKT